MRSGSLASHGVPALVLGADVTGLAVLKACGRRGVPAYGVGADRRLVARSRWYQRLPGAEIEETADGARLAAYLRTLPFEKTVLFPCSDQWTLAVGSLPADIIGSHVPTVAPVDILRRMVDKQLFSRMAAQHGVPAPRVVEAAELDTIVPDELPSFFLKPTDSQRFAHSFGVKALMVESLAQAGELIRSMSEQGMEMLLQEFIPGPPTSHVFVDGYVDKAGVMRACLARRRLRMHPRPFGNSTLSVTIPIEEVSEAVTSLRRLFEGVGYVGLFDAEFKHDARDGMFKILEVNARPWWQLEIATASGLDVCAMAYDDALGRPLSTSGVYRIGQTWVHPIPDLRAWRAARRLGDRAGDFPLRLWLHGANAIFSRDDPKPAIDALVRSAGHLLRTGRPLRRGGS